MSKTHQKIEKSGRGDYVLYARRLRSGHSHNSYNKKVCRRLERVRRKRESKKIKELENFVLQMAQLIPNLNDRLRLIEHQLNEPKKIPTDAEIIQLMEKLGYSWEVCKEKLMQEMGR